MLLVCCEGVARGCHKTRLFYTEIERGSETLALTSPLLYLLFQRDKGGEGGTEVGGRGIETEGGETEGGESESE